MNWARFLLFVQQKIFSKNQLQISIAAQHFFKNLKQLKKIFLTAEKSSPSLKINFYFIQKLNALNNEKYQYEIIEKYFHITKTLNTECKESITRRC